MTENIRKILNILLPAELFTEIEFMAHQENKTKGEFAREALRQYVESKKRWGQIRKWGEESARQMKFKDENDVDRAVHEFRL